MSTEQLEEFLNASWGEPTSSVQRDLYLNLTKLLSDSPLEETVRYFILLSVARSLNQPAIEKFAKSQLSRLDISDELQREAQESAAIMGMLNTYYKFKGYLPGTVAGDYQRTGLRMQSLAKPHVGKETFEMMAFAVSVVNGCPQCIVSHEKALRDYSIEPDKIHDLARLAAVVKGLSTLISNQ